MSETTTPCWVALTDDGKIDAVHGMQLRMRVDGRYEPRLIVTVEQVALWRAIESAAREFLLGEPATKAAIRRAGEKLRFLVKP